jgi:hypothetical protein
VRIDGERYFTVWRGGEKDRERLLLLRTSRLGSKLPHVLFAERRHGRPRVVHFVPDRAKVKKLPPPLFRGHVKRGDWPDTEALP